MTVETELAITKKITIKVIATKKELLPTYSSSGAAGADLKAHIDKDVIICPGKATVIPTGLHFEIPEGFEIQIRSRSGLASKQQIMVLNSPGTIDSDYRGEVGVILMNLAQEDFRVTPGMRIAQMVVAQVIQAQFIETAELSSSTRGSQGFGHTGTH